MKEHQVRSPDLEHVRLHFGHAASEELARERYAWNLKAGLIQKDYVLVLAEWETDAEADKARLDWLDVLRLNLGTAVRTPDFLVYDEPVRKTLDRLRDAPKPTVTVIMRLEDVK